MKLFGNRNENLNLYGEPKFETFELVFIEYLYLSKTLKKVNYQLLNSSFSGSDRLRGNRRIRGNFPLLPKPNGHIPLQPLFKVLTLKFRKKNFR